MSTLPYIGGDYFPISRRAQAPDLRARSRASVDDRVDELAADRHEVGRERDPHAAQPLAVFGRRLLGLAHPAGARRWDAEIADHRDVGLAAGARRRRVRLLLDLFPRLDRG